MSSAEFAEWMAYYAIEPFGEERADLRMGVLASLIANINRDPKKQREPFTPSDFMPRFEVEPQPKRVGWQEMLAKMKAIKGDKSRKRSRRDSSARKDALQNDTEL